MNKLLSLLMILLFSCSTSDSRNDFEFSDNMSFEDFKLKLEEYSRDNPYPNIDN